MSSRASDAMEEATASAPADTPPAGAEAGRLRTGHLAAYALPALPLAVIVFPSYAILPGFYALHTQISLATIGVILMVARVFDAVVDPAIGYLSDATNRQGSRKPWIVAGAIILSVSVVKLYAPAPTVGPVYYLGWFLTFYFGYSLIEIAHKAWGTDLARHYIDRSRIAASLAIAFGIGNLAFAAAPFLSSSGAQAYDAATLSLVAWSVAVVLPLAVLIAVWRAPSGQPTPSNQGGLSGLMSAVIANRLLLRYMSVFLLTGLGQGVFYGLVFLYVGSVLQLGDRFAWILLADAIVTLGSIPIWYALIRGLQKHRAWALGLSISAVAIVAMWALPVGEAAFLPLMLLICLRAFGACVIYVAPNALLGDVVDYELYKRKANRAANFHALVSLVTKMTASIGGGAGLLLVGLLGFDAKSINPPEVVLSFKAVALFASALVLLGGAAAVVGFPLDRARHEAIRQRLERRVKHVTGA